MCTTSHVTQLTTWTLIYLECWCRMFRSSCHVTCGFVSEVTWDILRHAVRDFPRFSSEGHVKCAFSEVFTKYVSFSLRWVYSCCVIHFWKRHISCVYIIVGVLAFCDLAPTRDTCLVTVLHVACTIHFVDTWHWLTKLYCPRVVVHVSC